MVESTQGKSIQGKLDEQPNTQVTRPAPLTDAASLTLLHQFVHLLQAWTDRVQSELDQMAPAAPQEAETVEWSPNTTAAAGQPSAPAHWLAHVQQKGAPAHWLAAIQQAQAGVPQAVTTDEQQPGPTQPPMHRATEPVREPAPEIDTTLPADLPTTEDTAVAPDSKRQQTAQHDRMSATVPMQPVELKSEEVERPPLSRSSTNSPGASINDTEIEPPNLSTPTFASVPKTQSGVNTTDDAQHINAVETDSAAVQTQPSSAIFLMHKWIATLQHETAELLAAHYPAGDASAQTSLDPSYQRSRDRDAEQQRADNSSAPQGQAMERLPTGTQQTHAARFSHDQVSSPRENTDATKPLIASDTSRQPRLQSGQQATNGQQSATRPSPLLASARRTSLRLRIHTDAQEAAETGVPTPPQMPIQEQRYSTRNENPSFWRGSNADSHHNRTIEEVHPSDLWPPLPDHTASPPPSTAAHAAADSDVAQGNSFATMWPALPPLEAASQPPTFAARPHGVQSAEHEQPLIAPKAKTARVAQRTSAPNETAESRWPTLLSERMPPAGEWRQSLRQQERRRRLDQEQRGQRWNA